MSDDLAGMTEDELVARRQRLTAAAAAAADRNDRATATRLQAMIGRVEDALVQIKRVEHEVADVDPTADHGNTRTQTGTTVGTVVHRRIGPRRLLCRSVNDLKPGSKVHPTDDPVSCTVCLGKIARADAEAAGEPPPPPTPRAPRKTAAPTGRRTGDPIPVALDVDLDPEPIPAADRDTAASTAGDLAALLLAAPIVAHLPLRAVGTITSASSVGVMASADGSLVVMAVD